MLDTIIVAAVIIVAAFFVGRRLIRPFLAKETSCGCSGCGNTGCCSTRQDSPDKHDCCGSR